MTQFTVTPEYIATAAANAHATAADIQGQLALLQNFVLELGASWLGVASGTFQQMMTNYGVHTARLHHALDEIGDGLQSNFANYVAAEETNVVALNGVDALEPANLGPAPTRP